MSEKPIMSRIFINFLNQIPMNGTDKLTGLFNSKDEFIEFFIKSCYFIPKESVKERAEEMLKTVESGKKLPIRYGKKLNANYKVEGAKALDKKSKREIVQYAKESKLCFKKNNILVEIDPTGNQSVVKAIYQATKHNVSTFDSTIINYTISHIWEGKTNNPLFFSSLWNVAIIPNFLNYIMDKPKKQHSINNTIQETIKAICYRLYNPVAIMHPYELTDVKEPKEEFLKIADKAIKNNWINYLPKNTNIVEKEEEVKEEKELTPIKELSISDDSDFETKLDFINKLNNKDFIFNLLNISVEYGIFEDLYPILIDKDLCKEYFLQRYPVLVDSKNKVDKDRYYQKNLFEYNGKSYYVTNDWYGDNSKNPRKNKTPFISMIREMIEEA